MERENFTRDEADMIIDKIDDERTKWSMKLYGIDIWDCRQYDLVMNIGRISVADATEIICRTITKETFQPTAESQQKIEQLESRLAQSETLQNKTEGMAVPEQRIDMLDQRVTDMEAFISKQLETLNARMSELEKSAAKPAPPKQTVEKKTEPPKSSIKYHTVRSGETLFGIASKYKISVDQLKRLNKMKSNTIHIGDKLRVSQ